MNLRARLNMNENPSQVLARVSQYFNINVFNSSSWDNLTPELQTKAIFNAYRILYTMLPEIYCCDADEMTIDLDDLCSEILWIIQKDDSVQRAEQGATSISLGDMSISFNLEEGARLIAPFIKQRYGLSETGQLRKVGQYITPRADTYRTGMHRGNRRFIRGGIYGR